MAKTFENGKLRHDVLLLEKRGCDFFKSDNIPERIDIGNYRVVTHGESIFGKDGNRYLVSFSLWRNRRQVRYTHKITGKPLKHPHFDIINPYGLHIDTEYTDKNGCWRNSALEKELHAYNYDYTIESILKVVNEINTPQHHYNTVLFADMEAIAAIPKILTLAGWREKNIIEYLTEVERVQADKNYLVYRYIDNSENYFDFEIKSGRITG